MSARTAQNVVTDALFISLVKLRGDSGQEMIQDIASHIKQLSWHTQCQLKISVKRRNAFQTRNPQSSKTLLDCFLYPWFCSFSIRSASFCRVQNKDRFGLSLLPNHPVLFVSKHCDAVLNWGASDAFKRLTKPLSKFARLEAKRREARAVIIANNEIPHE